MAASDRVHFIYSFCSIKKLVIRTATHKILGIIANRETPDHAQSGSLQSDLVLYSLFRLFGMYLVFEILEYSETGLKGPLKNRQNKSLLDRWQLSEVESIAEYSTRAFCNTFDLH